MEKAYIILAHKNPQQLYRLISKLTDGASSFFVHIDLTAPMKPFEGLYTLGKHVQVVERVDSGWGTIGAALAALNGLKAVKNAGKKADRIILLSGQDYPIKSNHLIDEYFQHSPYSVFIEYTPLPNIERWPNENGGLYRVNKYYFGLKPYQLFLSKSANLLATIFPFLGRKIPNGMKPYAGSQWWIIDWYALEYILKYVDSHPEYTNFHKNTFVCDELFFQMILLNSADERIAKSIQNDSKRFMKWKPSAAHPEILDTPDVPEMSASTKLFARKFDVSRPQVLDMIDG